MPTLPNGREYDRVYYICPFCKQHVGVALEREIGHGYEYNATKAEPLPVDVAARLKQATAVCGNCHTRVHFEERTLVVPIAEH